MFIYTCILVESSHVSIGLSNVATYGSLVLGISVLNTMSTQTMNLLAIINIFWEEANTDQTV